MTSNINTFLQFLLDNLRDTIIVRMEYKPNKGTDNPCPGHTFVMKMTIDPDDCAAWMGECMVFSVIDYKFVDLIESGCTCYENKGWFIHPQPESDRSVFMIYCDDIVPRFWNNRTGRGFSVVDQRWTWEHRSYVEVQL